MTSQKKTKINWEKQYQEEFKKKMPHIPSPKEIYSFEKNNNKDFLVFIRKWTQYDLYNLETQKKIYSEVIEFFKGNLTQELNNEYWEDLQHSIASVILCINSKWGGNSLEEDNGYGTESTLETLTENRNNYLGVIHIFNQLFDTKYDEKYLLDVIDGVVPDVDELEEPEESEAY